MLHKNSKDIESWLKLRNADGVGPVTFAAILKYFGSVDAALGASALSLKASGETTKKLVPLGHGDALVFGWGPNASD